MFTDPLSGTKEFDESVMTEAVEDPPSLFTGIVIVSPALKPVASVALPPPSIS